MAQAPRSLHVISSLRLSSGGPTESVVRLCEALNALGAPAEIATVAGPGETGPEPGDTPVHACALAGSPRLRRSPELAALLDRDAPRFDVIHVHGLWQWPGVAARRAALRHGRPLVISPRGMLEPWALRQRAWLKGLALRTWEGRNLRACDLFHATSESEAARIRALGYGQACRVVPNGIEVPGLSSLPSGEPRRSILFLGRFHPVKGGDLLLRAWAGLQAEFPGWRLVMAGPDEEGTRARWESLARSLDLPASAIHFGDPVSGMAKAQLFASAGLLALPSHSENFGNVVLEALAHGVPVLTTRGTPWAGLETHGCGWWVPCEEAALREALGSALALSDEARAAMGARGRAWARDFAWSAIAASMAAAYEDLRGAPGLNPGGETP